MHLNRIWFKDSVDIYELKSFFSFTKNDSVVFNEYAVYKYIYFDRRTLKCQDYADFNDTAQIMCNYALLPDEPANWTFFSGPIKENTLTGKLMFITDITINGVLYKRLIYKEQGPLEYQVEEKYFFRCDALRSELFRINTSLEKYFPNCPIVLIEVNEVGKSHLIDRIEYSIVRSSLTAEEEAVFAKWKQNAADTKLPILTKEDAIKGPMIPLKVRKEKAFLDEYDL